MIRRCIFHLFYILVLSIAHIGIGQELIKNQPRSSNITDITDIMKGYVPFRADGKINIPKNIKHIKLDIGLCYNAPMSQYWLSHEEDLWVFGFEPNPESIDAIFHETTKRLPSHGDLLEKKFIGKRFFLVPCALGLATSDTIKLFVTKEDSGCSSIYLPKYFDVSKIIEVPIFSLSEFFDIFPFDTHPIIDYIKIDAQGADLDIAKSAGRYLIERVVYITLEAENSQYKNTTNSYEIIDLYMRNLGFVRYISPYTCDPTYFNPRFSSYVNEHKVSIYQQG